MTELEIMLYHALVAVSVRYKEALDLLADEYDRGFGSENCVFLREANRAEAIYRARAAKEKR